MIGLKIHWTRWLNPFENLLNLLTKCSSLWLWALHQEGYFPFYPFLAVCQIRKRPEFNSGRLIGSETLLNLLNLLIEIRT